MIVNPADRDVELRPMPPMLGEKLAFSALPADLIRQIALIDPSNAVFHALRQLSSRFYSILPLSELRRSGMTARSASGSLRSILLLAMLIENRLNSSNCDDARLLTKCFVQKASETAKSLLFRYLSKRSGLERVLGQLPVNEWKFDSLSFSCRTDQQSQDLLRVLPYAREASSLLIRWERPVEESQDLEQLELGSFTRLRSLSLSWRVASNTGHVRGFLKRLPLKSVTSLENLSLKVERTAGLFDAPVQLASLKGLSKLVLQGFKIDAPLIDSILLLKRLKTLRIKSVLTDPALVKKLSALPALEDIKLCVSDPHVELAICDEVATMERLTRLKIDSSRSSGALFSSILRSCPSLHCFGQVTANLQLENEAETIASLRRFEKLHALQLDCGNQSVQFFEALLLLPALRVLKLTFDEGSKNFCQALLQVGESSLIETLSVIQLGSFDAELCNGIVRLAHLSKLSIGMEVSDDGMKVLGSHKKLQSVSLASGAAFTIKGLQALGNIPNLTSLNLGHDSPISAEDAKAFLEMHPHLEYFYSPRKELDERPQTGLIQKLAAVASRFLGSNGVTIKQSDKFLLSHHPYERSLF